MYLSRSQFNIYDHLFLLYLIYPNQTIIEQLYVCFFIILLWLYLIDMLIIWAPWLVKIKLPCLDIGDVDDFGHPVLFRTFGFIARKTLNYLAFQSVDFERTSCRLFQKHIMRTKFDIYVLITMIVIYYTDRHNCINYCIVVHWLYYVFHTRQWV